MMMVKGIVTACFGIAWGVYSCVAAAEDPTWFDDYGQAMKAAKQSKMQMLVYFCEEGSEASEDPLCTKFAEDTKLHPLLKSYVLARIPMSQRARVAGTEITLFEHKAFAELEKEAGIAVIDLEDPESKHYGYVVSIYPLSLPNAFTTKNLTALLSLPKGSLTQRTLVLAVRIHPEGPSSTDGTFLAALAEESEDHSNHQAAINVQGHHNWSSRFQRISGRLPAGFLAQEVVAESWPGKGLIRAALDVVSSWRQSSGHWQAVQARHRYYGYDMKRGRNGIWYATGIFGIR